MKILRESHINTDIDYDEITLQAKGSFHGGIHPKEYKTLSNQSEIKDLFVSSNLTLPIKQHIGFSGEVLVKKDDHVIKGQLLVKKKSDLSANIHSPITGKIIAIEKKYMGHISGMKEFAIEISPIQNELTTNIQDKSTEQKYKSLDWINTKQSELLNRIEEAGIVGLGGATFPTAIKLNTKKANQLIINAMECEPYITCDDKLLQEQVENVIQGAQISARIIDAEKIIFAIEDNKPTAIKQLQIAIKQSNYTTPMHIVVAPTKYPSGGEKQTIELITGQQLPSGKRPMDLGLVIQNVATAYAIYDAIVNGRSLYKRLVTITGNLAVQPGNYWIPFGTPISYIMENQQIDKSDCKQVILGGPLMGVSVTDYSVPVTKSTNCIIFNKTDDNEKAWLTQASQHQNCIRCGECETVCPANLVPQQLLWLSQSDQWEKLEENNLVDCIECGACAYVCPSEIPLVHYYRYAKSSLKTQKKKQHQSEIAKQRFEFREMRLQREKEERALRHKKAAEERKKAAQDRAVDPSGKQKAINDALQRVKNKKKLSTDAKDNSGSGNN